MPCLRELEIRCCNQLKRPVGLELILTNMPNEFAENVERVMVNANVEKVTWPFAPIKVRFLYYFWFYDMVHGNFEILLD